MSRTLRIKCAKYCYKRTILVELIVEDVVTFFSEYSVVLKTTTPNLFNGRSSKSARTSWAMAPYQLKVHTTYCLHFHRYYETVYLLPLISFLHFARSSSSDAHECKLFKSWSTTAFQVSLGLPLCPLHGQQLPSKSP